MAFVTHQVQCPYAPLKPLSWKKEIKSKELLAAFPKVKRTDGILLNHTSCLCITTIPLINGSNLKSRSKSSIKCGIQDSKEILFDEPIIQNIETPVTFEPNGTIAGSQAVQNLFKSWLILLRMPLSDQVAEGTLEGPFLNQIVESEEKIQNSGKSEVLKMVWCKFWRFNATIKIPTMIFIPMYLTIYMKYGTEVANELTPLWISGPLIMGLYITMIKLITSLYIFSFKQSINVLKRSLMVYDYIAGGKLQETTRVRFWTPVIGFWNLGYVTMLRRIQKDVQMWLVDKYMDYVESIWPSYCKFIRFLKRANFI